MTNEVKKCPFCGVRAYESEPDNEGVITLTCLGCPVEMIGIEGERVFTREELLEAWNRRFSDAIGIAQERKLNGIISVNKKDRVDAFEPECRKPSGEIQRDCQACADHYVDGWNACLDAVKMAGYRRVPSVEEIAEVIKKSELWRMSNYVGRDDASYSGINGTDRLARAVVEKMEGEKQ